MNETIEKDEFVIITGVSASGKTTLQEEMLSRGWKRPINFTTRKPRSDAELDEYVFLTKKQFFTKLQNGDMLEHTNYGGNWYGVSAVIPKGRVCVVLDPIGKMQVLEKMAREGLGKPKCYYLEISKELQMDRLIKRGDDVTAIQKRVKDFDWFGTYQRDVILSGEWSSNTLADIIEGN